MPKGNIISPEPENKSDSASSATIPTRDAAAAAQLTADLAIGFQLIGQFVFEFSQLEFSIRFMLANRLGLHDDYFDIVTAPYDFSKLCMVTKAVLRKQLPDRQDAIEQLFKDCLKLNAHRVHVAHGLWTLGEEGPVARKVSNSSLKPQLFFEHKDQLKELAREAQRLMQSILTVAK